MVVFTAILSVVFLKRKQYGFHWLGVALVVLGTIVVGLGAFFCSDGDSQSAPNPKLGDIIIIVAQLIVAVQMCVEEKFIGGHNVPALQVVGLEGCFGFSFMLIIAVVAYFIPAPSFMCGAGMAPEECTHFEVVLDAFTMIKNNYKIGLFMCGNIISIAFFNFCGVSVTKHLSAAHRMVIDSTRTILVWSLSLALSFESFCYLNLIGFAPLLVGALIYNSVFRVPKCTYPTPVDTPKTEERTALLSDVYTPGGEGGVGALGYESGSAINASSPMLGATSYDAFATPTLSKARTMHAR